jgi:hypothetical protein
MPEIADKMGEEVDMLEDMPYNDNELIEYLEAYRNSMTRASTRTIYDSEEIPDMVYEGIL